MKKTNKECLLSAYYNLQKKHHDRYGKEPVELKHARTWLEEDNLDYWRHERMYKMINPLLVADKNASWLTVGDGRYGRDAHYIGKRGVKVLATDISVALLKKAKRISFISAFKRENAEKLSFKNNSFDYVFCKESYHHLPRPTIGLYEMLRVAKKAVILIEPNDVREGKYLNSFEESGNYVYKISEREIEKMALGVGLKFLAFNGLDDYYIKGVEYRKIHPLSFMLIRIKVVLAILDIFYKLKVRERSLLVAVIFKNEPDLRLRKALGNFGYRIVKLPQNPYGKK
jgi:SAM-dependent methyltransferase